MVPSYKVDKINKKKKKVIKDAKVEKKEKVKLKDLIIKNKIIIIIILVIIILGAGSSFTVWYKEYNKPTNKLKRYLDNNGYKCGKSTCRKVKDNKTYIISYTSDSYQMTNDYYTLNISKRAPYIVVNGKTKICSYENEDYEPLTDIDKSFTNDKDCAKYIEEINENIKYYKNILSNARVDIKEIED